VGLGDVAVSWLAQLLKLKPEFLPKWIFWLLLLVFFLIALAVLAVGLWVMFTQVEYL
jgi:hypothetical protein